MIIVFAILGLPALAARAGEVRVREIVKPTGIEAVREYAAQLDEKKLWLWGSLVLAVIVIVGVTLKLSRQMPAPGARRRRAFPARETERGTAASTRYTASHPVAGERNGPSSQSGPLPRTQ